MGSSALFFQDAARLTREFSLAATSSPLAAARSLRPGADRVPDRDDLAVLVALDAGFFFATVAVLFFAAALRPPVDLDSAPAFAARRRALPRTDANRTRRSMVLAIAMRGPPPRCRIEPE